MSFAAATSDPRATAAAAEVLADGGTAMDAAVAATLLLYVVEPQSCGVGGDAFLMHAEQGQVPVALDGAGAIPGGLTQAALEADGFDAVPPAGPRSVTVPGSVDLLATALERFGSYPLAEVAEPAISAAREGFEVRPHLAEAVERTGSQLAEDPVLGPLYVPGGRGVREGESVRNPGLADCLEELVASGGHSLYRGGLADEIGRQVGEMGGYLKVGDLAEHRTEQSVAETTDFLGRTVLEFPLPTQGPAVLRALEEIGEVEVASPVQWGAVLEALRGAMRQVGFDPGAIILSKPRQAQGDTSYLAVIDEGGRTVSLITSLFGAFGALFGVPALGGPLHNRATTLRMVGQQPRPGKPPHTIIPALVTRDGAVEHALGVAGGMMQPQAQVQVLLRLLVEDMTPQQAIDAPRFKICFGGDVALETGHPLGREMAGALAKNPGPEGFGACQVAGWPGGRLAAGADKRRGGAATVAAP